jgi:hypothetical protein
VLALGPAVLGGSDERGSIEIEVRAQNTRAPLEGVVVTVSVAGGQVVGKVATDSAGHAEIR